MTPTVAGCFTPIARTICETDYPPDAIALEQKTAWTVFPVGFPIDRDINQTLLVRVASRRFVMHGRS
jgi:hypothetical protein